MYERRLVANPGTAYWTKSIAATKPVLRFTPADNRALLPHVILGVILAPISFVRFVAISLIFNGLLFGQALFQKPVKVLGDPAFVGTASQPTLIEGNGPNAVEGRELSGPSGIALDTSASPPILYIADAGNNRVLGYQFATQLTAGSIADIIIGQIDRFSNLPQGPGSGRSTGLNTPTSVAVDASGNLYVADTNNNRILRFPRPMQQTAGSLQLPDMVIGQTSFNSRAANAGGIGAGTLALGAAGGFVRNGIAFDSAGNLWVADTLNNRVLRFPVSLLKNGTNGPKADLVVGQPDFTTVAAVNSRNAKTGMIGPQGIAFDAAGRLLVTDGASRLLVYPPGISSNSAVAIRIAGVDSTTTNTATQVQLNSPLGVTASSAGVIVADTSNNRLLLYPTVDTWAAENTQFSPSATQVLGQTSYTASLTNQGNGDASATTLNAPVDVAISSNELYVADFQNNRVLVFPISPSGATGSASRVIGQLDFPFFAPNLIEGKEFSFSASNSSSAILDLSATPPHLYVADTNNNRILGFNDSTHFSRGLQAADLVIGQPDFNRAQINYPTNKANTPNQQGLFLPTSLAVDSAGNLYVTDTGNSRVLRFPAPYASGKTALESADLVIGQNSFTTTVTDATAQTLATPIGIALTAGAANPSGSPSGWLVVSDSGHNRVLFFPTPLSSGMSANKVLGALNFTSTTTGSADPPRFASPRGLAVDSSDRVIVADTGNHRVQIFNPAASINNFDTPPVSLSANLSSPVGIGVPSTGYWIADAGAGALFHYQPFNQLVLGNKSPDASLPVGGPTSVFADPYNNLVVCDGANRVLYFAPQATAVSAATYSKRALTPGMFSAVFPTVTTNVIGPGTAAATTQPLPNVLSDTQVLINNTPAPLFFVSPGQINVELPNGLPAGGTADLQVIRQSTGQIYASAELQLGSADPGLFTLNGSGGGPVAAINVADGTVNSASNPVSRGQFISLYGTGQGFTPNAPPDGTAPTGPVNSAAVPMVQLGPQGSGKLLDAANITYSGLAPFLVGVWQINIMVPADAPTGSVPITVFQNSVPSNDQVASVGTATISIK